MNDASAVACSCCWSASASEFPIRLERKTCACEWPKPCFRQNRTAGESAWVSIKSMRAPSAMATP